jgi:spore germination cell wall hydrolase CwlJ-like protein
MKQTVRAGGIAAASLALVATISFAGPSVASSAQAIPAVSYTSHAQAGLGGDTAINNNVSGGTAQGSFASPVAQHAIATIGNVANQAYGNAVPQRRSLSELVQTHAGAPVNDAERECLAGAVYFEARGESIDGQLAVAEVVLNRAASGKYPKSICGVVKQPWQFSFVRNGQFPRIDKGSEAWRKATAIAHIAAENLADQLTPDVLWYHANYVAPSWGRRLNRVTQIGAHIFYR